MTNRRFEVYEYRQLLFRLRAGEKIREIARSGLASRKKIKAVRKIAQQHNWLNPQQDMPSDEELSKAFSRPCLSPITQSRVLPYRSLIEKWISQGIQATTMHAALKREYDFKGSYNSVQRFVQKLKNNSREVTIILEFKPGEYAQVDFGAGPKLIGQSKGEVISTWIFVMVLAWSRHMYAEVVLKQDVATWLGCHRRAFEWFNGVPHKVTIDNPKCAITKACYYDPVVQRAYYEYAEGYEFMVSPCPPREPKKKGRVESGVKYVKRNFVPLRTFIDINDANAQLKKWLLETAGNRNHGTTHDKPLNLFTQTEKLLLKPLPINPPECAAWQRVVLHSDCHVSYLKCRYSASYKLVGETLWLRSTETTIRIYHEHELVAVHPRLTKPGLKSSLDEHLPPNAIAYCMKDVQWCTEQAKTIGVHCEKAINILLTNSVVDYLRAAQGVISLQKKYGNARLEASCRRALAFNSISYKTIKDILKNGLEYEPFPEEAVFEKLADTYTGQGRFYRDISTLLQ